MSSATSPILVLDSGLGGLTVVRSLRRLLPNEDLMYFGDTARVPYGSKSAATVTNFVRQIIQYAQPHEPKHVVIACNTATALALNAVRQEFPHLPISGVVEPGARAAVEASRHCQSPLIGVIATDATIRSRAYEHALSKRRQYARLLCQPTPLLVHLIEEGRTMEDPVVRLAVEQYLKPMLEHKMDVLVLGCTHYPIYRPLFASVVGAGVAVIDSADKCAEDVLRRLRAAKLERGPRADAAALRCFVTDDAPRFGRLASRFLGLPIEPPVWVSPDELALLPTETGASLRAAV